MKKLVLTLAVLITAFAVNAKTLVVYYSYTNNVERIVEDLRTQIETDVVEIEPAEKGLDYAANNYAIGSAQIAAIRNNPNDADSYPEIDPVDVDLAEYDMIIVAAPLWWSQMAAPLQTYLFHNGASMAGKKIGLIVSSASSGISGVEADAKRLIPEGDFVNPSLWIRSGQTSNCHSLISSWLEEIHYNDLATALETIYDESVKTGVSVSNGMITVNGVFDTLDIYNMAGHKVLGTSERTVGTDNLSNGLYIASVTNGAKRVAHKLVINK